jgi:hypothetical protein
MVFSADKQKNTTANTGFASGGLTCKLEALASIQVQCLLTVLCSETRPNAKPETVRCNAKHKY